jgi:hypothetical protein
VFTVPPSAPTSIPRVLFLAAALIALEALAAVIFGVVTITRIEPGRFLVGAGVTLLMFGYGAGLALVARGVGRGRRWSRGPAVATQLLQGLLASSFTGPTWPIGLALGTPAVAALVCLLLPAATVVFTREQTED